MDTYMRLIAVLIVRCRGVNVLLRVKPIRFNLQSCTFISKMNNGSFGMDLREP